MSSPKRVLMPPQPESADLKYDNSGRVYADMDALIERELVRIRERIRLRLKKAAELANGTEEAAASLESEQPKA